MPEAPDLEIIKDVLNRRVAGQRIETVEVIRPLVVRVLLHGLTAPEFLAGRTINEVRRRGKFLLFALDSERWAVINFMLAGHLRYCPRRERVRARDYVLLHLTNGHDLRYHDAKGMGKIYLTDDLGQVPGFPEMGPDVLDSELTVEFFLEGLRRHRGEIKGILTRGRVAAGIGNAYADEILFRSGIYPFRRRTSLSAEEQMALYHAVRDVPAEAIDVLRERMGEDIHLKVRDVLQGHNTKGQPCPRCGRPISEIKVARRATNFCRSCQPGSMFRG